jgi:hypothetical protein
MIASMKEKDTFSLGVIRMAKGAIQLEAINKKKELTEDEMIAVVAKQIKMRNDSIAEFTKADRLDLVEKIQYLPALIKNMKFYEPNYKSGPYELSLIKNYERLYDVFSIWRQKTQFAHFVGYCV